MKFGRADTHVVHYLFQLEFCHLAELGRVKGNHCLYRQGLQIHYITSSEENWYDGVAMFEDAQDSERHNHQHLEQKT